jgi:hypothetical protein
MKKLLNENSLKILNKISTYSLAIIPIIILIVGLAINDWIAERFVLFYFLPIVIIALLWLFLRLKKYNTLSKTVIIIDVLVFISAIFRLIGILPFSSHMLFLTYSIITTDNKYFRILTVLIILETTYLKLFIWNDTLSWVFGGLIGFALGIFSYFINMPNPLNK